MTAAVIGAYVDACQYTDITSRERSNHEVSSSPEHPDGSAPTSPASSLATRPPGGRPRALATTRPRRIQAAGAEVFRGSIDDPDALRAPAEASDGVIHLAFNHDFSAHLAADRDRPGRHDRAARGPRRIGSALRVRVRRARQGRRPGVVATEDTVIDSGDGRLAAHPERGLRARLCRPGRAPDRRRLRSDRARRGRPRLHGRPT